jgi:hypothetical protein
MISTLLGGTTSIKDLFSPNLESFSLFSSSTDASGNPTPTTDASGNPTPTTDASGNGIFGNTFSLFSSSSSSSSSSSTDASGNATPNDATSQDQNRNSGNPNGSTSSDADSNANGNINPSIAPYADFFKSLFYLFIQICVIGYIGSSFLTLVRMASSKSVFNKFIPSDINTYPYCTPSDQRLGGQGAQNVEIEDDPLYSFGFPYNLYCDPGDDNLNTCSKTCGTIKRELKDPNAFFEYTPFSFWIAMSSKNTYATFRAFVKMVCTSMSSIVTQDKYDSYGVVENIVMAIGVLFIYIVGLYGGFIGFFMTYMFQIYNSGFMMFGLAWTFGLFLLSWIPPFLNFFGFIFQSIIMFLWIPFTQVNEATQSKVVFEIFKKKKSVLMLLFSLGMVMNAFKYLKDNEPYYVVVAVALFLFNMYAFTITQ